MAIAKSNLLSQLKKSYPNFLKKDLNKVVSVVLNEIKQALKNGEKVNTPEKKTIHFKMAKEMFKKLNND